MHTTKFTIENYLAEYLRGKWGLKDENGNNTGIIEIPPNVYLYNILHSLMIKKPAIIKDLVGNIEIVIPNRKEMHKNPAYYNFISKDAARYFNKKLKLFFRADLHEFLDHKKHDNGDTFKDACFLFIEKYNIESIDPESLIKNYSRWKGVVRDNRDKRAYTTR